MIQQFHNHVDYSPSKIFQPSYMKIMLLVLHKLKDNLEKVIELSISLQVFLYS